MPLEFSAFVGLISAVKKVYLLFKLLRLVLDVSLDSESLNSIFFDNKAAYEPETICNKLNWLMSGEPDLEVNKYL